MFDSSGTDAGINFYKAVIKRHKLEQKILKQIRWKSRKSSVPDRRQKDNKVT